MAPRSDRTGPAPRPFSLEDGPAAVPIATGFLMDLDLMILDRCRAAVDSIARTSAGPRGRLRELREAGVQTGIWWYADHPTHYAGDARPATAEAGERLLDARARAIARAVRAIKDDTEARRLQDEFFAGSAVLARRRAPRRDVGWTTPPLAGRRTE